MIFTESKLKGAYIIDVQKLEDERGFFARSWCQHEFEQHALETHLVQCNISYNKTKGTLRGMHYQQAPCAEAKLVRCTRGVLYDVIIDLRADSATYLQWVGAELSENNYRMMYAPEGFAHGFLTLQDNTEIFYQMTEFYSPAHARGLRWDDPLVKVTWPAPIRVISERDRNYTDFHPEE